MKNNYSDKLCTDFPNSCFLSEFRKSVDNFFLNTYDISSAQYTAINKHMLNSFFENFCYQIDDISRESLNRLYSYLAESLNNIIIYMGSANLLFKNIVFASGETHNYKKSILIIEVNNIKIVYRPYDMQQLQLLTDIFDFIKSDLRHDIYIFPKILFYTKKYSIIEYINPEKISDCDKFYYSIGIVLAFSCSMRIVDLFNDNVLFSNNTLFVVASEICFFRNIDSQALSLLSLGLIGHKHYSGLDNVQKCSQFHQSSYIKL